MTAFEHIRGGVTGLFLGAVATPIISLIGMKLFYKGGGFVTDFAPFFILIFGVIWGAFSGTIFGLLLLSPLKSPIAGFILAFSVYLLLFLMNIAEIGFSRTVDKLYGDGHYFDIGIFCFFVVTIILSCLIAAVNQFMTKDLAVQTPQCRSDKNDSNLN